MVQLKLVDAAVGLTSVLGLGRGLGESVDGHVLVCDVTRVPNHEVLSERCIVSTSSFEACSNPQGLTQFGLSVMVRPSTRTWSDSMMVQSILERTGQRRSPALNRKNRDSRTTERSRVEVRVVLVGVPPDLALAVELAGSGGRMDVGSVSLLKENVRRFVLVGEEDLGLDWRTELSVHKLRGKTTRKRLTDGGNIRRLAELAIPL